MAFSLPKEMVYLYYQNCGLSLGAVSQKTDYYNQCSSQDFFIERGKKTGGYIVMVHCFNQSVCFLSKIQGIKKRRGKNYGKEKGIKRKGQTMEEKIGRKERKKKEEKRIEKRKKKGEVNKTIGKKGRRKGGRR